MLPEGGDAKGYVTGIATEIIGMIITTIFVQWLFDRSDEKKKQMDEAGMILRADRIVSLLINNYEIYLSWITHDEQTGETAPLDRAFSITDLQYVHDICLSMMKDYTRSRVSLFLENELELRKLFTSLIQNIDYQFNDEILQCQIEFVSLSIKWDVREGILKNETMTFGDGEKKQRFTDEIKRWLSDGTAEKIQKALLEGTLDHSNEMQIYVLLYEMIDRQRLLLVAYREFIKELRSKPSSGWPSAEDWLKKE